MNKKRSIPLSALLVAGAFAAPIAIAADMKAVAGTYTIVSITQTSADGKKSEPFGPKPMGMTVFARDGHYVNMVRTPDLPKFAANTRMQATPEEMKAVVQGSIAHYGKYEVKGDAILFHIERATFPNWDGTTQKRTFKMEGDTLRYHVPAASAGGTAEVVLRRVK